MIVSCSRARRRPGFSTLEALAAVAIVAIALTPLIALQSYVARTHLRHDQIYERTRLQRNAFALLRDLNPSTQPEGAIELEAGVRMSWVSRAKTAPTLVAGYPIGDGEFDVTLFEVQVLIENARGEEKARFAIDRVGWQPRGSAGFGRAPLR